MKKIVLLTLSILMMLSALVIVGCTGEAVKTQTTRSCPIICTDSDKGDNPFIKGTTEGPLSTSGGVYWKYTDKCILAKDEFSDNYFELNPGTKPEDIGVEEGVCGNIVDGEIKEIGVIVGTNVIPGPNWHKCDNGCKDGACRK